MRHVPEMPERKEQRFAVGEAPAVQRQGFNPETNMKRGSLFFQRWVYIGPNVIVVIKGPYVSWACIT